MAMIQAIANKLNPSQLALQKRKNQVAIETQELVGMEWPPEGSIGRLDQYQTYSQILDGDHMRAFSDVINLRRWPQYIPYNIGELICTVEADLLMGEYPGLEFDRSLRAEDGSLDPQAKDLQDYWASEEAKVYEITLDAIGMGDAVIHMVQEDGNSPAKFDALPVTCWFPQSSPNNMRDVAVHRVAWVRTIRDKSGGEVEYVVMAEYHPNGTVQNRLFLLGGERLTAEMMPGTDAWGAIMGATNPEVISRVDDDFIIRHLPHWRYSRSYFGRSNLHSLREMLGAINNRISQTNHILTNHADPVMSGPDSALDDFGQFDKDETQYIVREEEEVEVKYINYDVKVEDNVKYMDKLVDWVLMKSETARVLLGMADGGNNISGRALKFQMIRSLAKINRIRKYHNVLWPDLLVLKQRMDGAAEAIRPTLKWEDGLPQDIMELLAELEARDRMGIGDPVQAVQRLDAVGEKSARDYIGRIKADGPRDTSTSDTSGLVEDQPKSPGVE